MLFYDYMYVFQVNECNSFLHFENVILLLHVTHDAFMHVLIHHCEVLPSSLIMSVIFWFCNVWPTFLIICQCQVLYFQRTF